MVSFQLLLQPCNNVFAYSIYGTGGEVERNNLQVDWGRDVTGNGYTTINVQAAHAHPAQLG